MPHSTGSPTESLSALEDYLSCGPVGECSDLNDIPNRLSKLIGENDVETAEKIVQLLGTAVGQQSQASS